MLVYNEKCVCVCVCVFVCVCVCVCMCVCVVVYQVDSYFSSAFISP
jgi:hypothetical protein